MLCYLHYHYPRIKEGLIEYLEEMEIDSEIFCHTHLKLWEYYIATFEEKYLSHSEDKFFFGDEDLNFILFIVTLWLEYPDFEEWAEDKAVDTILDMLVMDSDEDFTAPKEHDSRVYIEFLDQLSLEDTIKWKLLSLLCNPGKWFSKIKQIFEANRSAYEYAVDKYHKEITDLIAQCSVIDNPHFEKIVSDFTEKSKVYLSLAFPFVEWVGINYCFYGALNHKLIMYQDERNQNKETLLTGLKLLSDKSKFEILCSLKERPKYNLEIAQQLHLTPATMSHHMNLLLSGGFVTIEKAEGKMYYHLSSKKIKEMIKTLKQLFM